MAKIQTRDPIPEFNSLGEIAEFWDAHSTADYDDLTHEVEFELALTRKKSLLTLPFCQN